MRTAVEIYRAYSIPLFEPVVVMAFILLFAAYRSKRS